VVKEWTPACIKQRLHYHNIVPWLFWKFTYDGIQPDKVVEHLKKDLPILFVTVENDHSVPAQSTVNLIEQLKQSGHEHVHHKHLLQGKHGRLLAGPDAQEYKEALRAFFNRYVTHIQ
jgi:pimeloyl-ACP methyl ester carboxylesterase